MVSVPLHYLLGNPASLSLAMIGYPAPRKHGTKRTHIIHPHPSQSRQAASNGSSRKANSGRREVGLCDIYRNESFEPIDHGCYRRSVNTVASAPNEPSSVSLFAFRPSDKEPRELTA